MVTPQHRPLICTLRITPPRLQQVERCTKNQEKRRKEKEPAVISRGYRQSHCRRTRICKNVTVEETEVALKKTRLDKEFGPDEVTAELWKSKFGTRLCGWRSFLIRLLR
ncbi:unnamed protein product [Heligmosomoides polygyrus]|uniref:HTH_48 domain-containing protein n=1 Tax=Heligmosomoides polygyrus TaxID=6339 RepID=A0A183F848_HELPZ|nr:unnamed protein product [Heligmosomoides polygyrus]